MSLTSSESSFDRLSYTPIRRTHSSPAKRLNPTFLSSNKSKVQEKAKSEDWRNGSLLYWTFVRKQLARLVDNAIQAKSNDQFTDLHVRSEVQSGMPLKSVTICASFEGVGTSLIVSVLC